jgi:hypothetical protein
MSVPALAALAILWDQATPGGAGAGSAEITLLAVILAVGVVLGAQFPIHVRAAQKMGMDSVALFLTAVLLPPPLAAVTAGVGVLTAEMISRGRRGATYSDIATTTARWVLITLLTAELVHLQGGDEAFNLLLLATGAGLMWIGDILTLPLLLTPITGETAGRVIVETVRAAGATEGAQYLLGLLGALAVTQQIGALALLAVPVALVYLAFKSAREMHDGTRQLLESLADTVDLRDPYTGGHSRRVADLTAGMLRELQIEGATAATIVAAARVHDIGKIGVPDQVLHKPGVLTAEERAIMETHPERGADLLRRYPDFAQGVEIVRHHHERWDGTGYPYRLKGTDIPLGARIVAVADSFDAMTSDRPYRPALPVRKAVEILRAGRGEQWDAVIVDAFLRSIRPQIEQAGPSHLRLVENTEDASEPAILKVRA